MRRLTGFIYLVVLVLLVHLISACGNKMKESNGASEIYEGLAVDDKDSLASKGSVDSMLQMKQNYALDFVNNYLNRIVGDGEYHQDLMEWLANDNSTSIRFRNELDSLITKAEEDDPEIGLGYDPIIEGQDYAAAYELDYYDADKDFFLLRGIVPENAYTVKIRIVDREGRLWVDGCGEINMK